MSNETNAKDIIYQCIAEYQLPGMYPSATTQLTNRIFDCLDEVGLITEEEND